jgi:hypothetical protein
MEPPLKLLPRRVSGGSRRNKGTKKESPFSRTLTVGGGRHKKGIGTKKAQKRNLLFSEKY